GVWGVMALGVSARTAEIGLRLALGAAPAQVLRAVLTEGLALTAAGIAAGLAGALAIVPLLSTQLYGIRAFDPPTVATVPAILLIVAMAACLAPARRAMTVDPVDALRSCA